MLLDLLRYYLIIVNIVGFAIMGIDKKRAIRGAWRISEASLFFVAIIGGSLGCIFGMQYFRHKTKHWYFQYGMPCHPDSANSAFRFLYYFISLTYVIDKTLKIY